MAATKEATTRQTEATPTRLIPLTEWPNYHPCPPIGGLGHLVFHSRTNGSSVCVKRAGRRVLIDEAEFFRFVERQGGTGNYG